MVLIAGVALVISMIAALLIVPLVRRIAPAIGMVDQPDKERKLHSSSIALGGGIAVLAGLLTGVAVAVSVAHSTAFASTLSQWTGIEFNSEQLDTFTEQWFGLILAAIAMLCVGLVDDIFVLRGRQKLLCQILIISALVGTGTVVDRVGLFGMELQLGSLAFPGTVLWLLVCVNALNLIDGADGVATTTGFFISLGLAVISLHYGSTLGSLFAFALAGSLMGFLWFNKPPATIFLGDAGSMVIGLFVGVISVWSSVKESTLLASAPIAILAVPLIDSAAAITRRWLTGRSIYAADRAHLHHLLQRKYGQKKMLLIVAGLCSLATGLAIASAIFNAPMLAVGGFAGVICLLLVTRSFGYAECQLVAMKLSNLTHSMFARPSGMQSSSDSRWLPLQGSGDWQMVWEPLVQMARINELSRLSIDLNLSSLHEGFHANWSDSRQPNRDSQASMRWPIIIRLPNSHVALNVGTLTMVADAERADLSERFSNVCSMLGQMETQIHSVIAKLDHEVNLRQSKSQQVVPKPASVGRDVLESESAVAVSVPSAPGLKADLPRPAARGAKLSPGTLHL